MRRRELPIHSGTLCPAESRRGASSRSLLSPLNPGGGCVSNQDCICPSVCRADAYANVVSPGTLETLSCLPPTTSCSNASDCTTPNQICVNSICSTNYCPTSYAIGSPCNSSNALEPVVDGGGDGRCLVDFSDLAGFNTICTKGGAAAIGDFCEPQADSQGPELTLSGRSSLRTGRGWWQLDVCTRM